MLVNRQCFRVILVILLNVTCLLQVNSRENQPKTALTTVGDDLVRTFFQQWEKEDKRTSQAAHNTPYSPPVWMGEQRK